MVFNGKEKVNIVFRVDASEQIGSGHLMRCLTLADAWREKARSTFITRPLVGAMPELIEQRGHSLLLLPKMKPQEDLEGYERWLTVKQMVDAEQTKAVLQAIKTSVEMLVVDHYAIDETWEKTLRPQVKQIFVIDDLANRRHDCDVLLDQNYYRNMQMRYDNLVSKYCRLLLGPAYALLRREFYEEQKKLRKRDVAIRRILVFFGGSDQSNETEKALQAIEKLERSDLAVDVVVGQKNPHRLQIEAHCRRQKRWTYYCQVDCMAKLMHAADLAIGAGGTTTWERCFLGLPSLVLSIAENQERIAEDCAALGYMDYLGKKDTVKADDIAEKLLRYIEEPESLQAMEQAGRRLMKDNTGEAISLNGGEKNEKSL